MKLIGLMPARNEDWILGLSARVALSWCDDLAILDHASDDRTPAIIEDLAREFPGRVIALREQNSKWDEMKHRQALINAARTACATHIALIDADEILTGNLLAGIRGMTERLPYGSILELPGYNLRGELERYHSTGIWADRWFSVAFADDPRLGWSGDRFHHREPMGLGLSHWRTISQNHGGVMHLWGLSERRLVAKHAAYKMVETLRWPEKSRTEINRMYSQAFDPAMNPRFDQTWRFARAPDSWWEPHRPMLGHLHAYGEPWQERFCRDLYAQYGANRFLGLDLFGVCEEVIA